MQNGSSVGICAHCINIFARLAPICKLCRCLVTKIYALELNQKFVKIALLVGISFFREKLFQVKRRGGGQVFFTGVVGGGRMPLLYAHIPSGLGPAGTKKTTQKSEGIKAPSRCLVGEWVTNEASCGWAPFLRRLFGAFCPPLFFLPLYLSNALWEAKKKSIKRKKEFVGLIKRN